MLSPIEKMLFVLLALLAVGATYQGFYKMWLIINRGEGKLYLDHLPQRLFTAIRVYITQETTLKTRRVASLFHLGIVLGFTFYFLVNAIDVLIGMISGFEAWLKALTGLPAGIYDVYRLAADVLSIVVLVGVAYFILRRLVLPNKKDLTFHDNVLLHPHVKAGGVFTDSMIVASFIMLHVGARFLGEAVLVAQEGADPFMPFATLVAPLFAGIDEGGLTALRHAAWWVALGGILLFSPYFPYTKHAHLFMAPLNFLTRPKRTSLGELEPVNFDDESKEQFGANKLEHLTKTQIFDAFACIQCNRCQDVCPAYLTGKELSPSALEINKRYFIREHFNLLAMGEESPAPLVGSVISESAVWACTACGACIDICPVGNEPMYDILDIRRDLVLTQAEMPGEIQTAFTNMEKRGNPWGVSGSRVAWAEGLDVPTVEENPAFDILYWTGCAVSYDDRAKKTARDFVTVLKAAGVNFAILGDAENCTGDVARRGGNEYLYFELATGNVETLKEVQPKRIVATCPHCLHNLGKEYHQFGGDFTVIHHTELINELIQAGKLPASANPAAWSNVTFHDPCYLGRHNDIVAAPREALTGMGAPLVEMPRNRKNSLCCGAGGAQFWKEEEHGQKAVNLERYEEATATGAETLAVGCPFCMQMFESVRANTGTGPVVKDVVELMAERLAKPVPAAGD
ncbi:MAG: heterodisulfide reductase-related iron-sulfur binding cluster [Anaerolineae bacterium]|nr:heterodisulfide reductase-related iron-sulfur binding cluster [Anaerolineae bacterium]